MDIHFSCKSTFSYLNYLNHVHVSPNPGRQITLHGSQGHLLGKQNNKNWTKFLHVHWNSIKI